MTNFKEQMSQDLSQIFYNVEEFAHAAVYSPVSGDDVSCRVMVDHDVLVQADGYDAGVATMGTTITAMVSDVGTVARGATFIMDDVGTVYTVQRIDLYSDDGLEVTMVVK